jgi:hypothetical protein
MFRIAQFLILLVAATSFATEFIPSSLPSQVSQVPIIVRGTIGMTYSDWGSHDDGGRGLFTFYQLQPSEVLKGQVSAGTTILFREIGGEKDGVGETVPGAAQFTRGEDVVVMLGPQNKDGSYDIKGLSAGKFNITREEDGSESLTSVALSPAPHDGKWTIADLKKAVREQSATSPSPVDTKPSPSASPAKENPVASEPNPAASQLQTLATEPPLGTKGAKGPYSLPFGEKVALGLILIGIVIMTIRKGGQSKK